MLGQFKPVAFDPYGRRRSARHLPPWLVLLLTGIGIGVLGFVIVQEVFLPTRLSAEASSRLRRAFEQADAERLRLGRELGEISKRLETSLGERKRLAEELAASRADVERSREDVATVIAALPPDPRGGVVEVRAGWFTAKGGVLAYNVLLTRERAAGQPLAGVVQLLVTGESARGNESTISLKPVTVSIGSQQIVRGSQPLPEGFKPRQTTIQVLDRAAGTSLGMRVMLVK